MRGQRFAYLAEGLSLERSKVRRASFNTKPGPEWPAVWRMSAGLYRDGARGYGGDVVTFKLLAERVR